MRRFVSVPAVMAPAVPRLAQSIPRVAVITTAVFTVFCGPAVGATFYWGNPAPQGNPLRSVIMLDGQTGVTVGDRGAVLRTTDAGTTWTDLTNWPALTQDLKCVRKLPDGSLLAVGGSPGIYRSTDQGTTWTPVSNPSTGTLLHLAFAGGQVWSAIGTGGRVLRSLDNGATWSTQPSPGSADLVDQFWLDPQNGYVLGPDLVRHTTDGGQTWLHLPDVQETFFLPGDIQFLDPQNGWILVDFTTWRTTDGGASWFQKHGQFGQSPGYQQEALFIDANTRFVCDEGEGGDIWKTTDDGLHWQKLYERLGIGGYSDIFRTPGGRLLVVSDAGDFLRSDDGASWINYTRAPTDGERQRIEAIVALPDGRCFAGGDGSFWSASTDFGHSWMAPVSVPPMGTIFSIGFRGSVGLLGGVAVPGHSVMARTTDGGTTWTSPVLSSSYVGYGVSVRVPGDSVAYVATYGGSNVNYLFRSTDAGATWQQRNSGLPVSVRFNSLYFLDEQNGFLGGGESGISRVWKTTDGGGSWTQLPGNGLGTDGVGDMHWFNSSVAVVASLSGLRRTTDGGSNWAPVDSRAFQRVEFADDHHGYASVLSGGYLESTDAGRTWTENPFPLVASYLRHRDDPDRVPGRRRHQRDLRRGDAGSVIRPAPDARRILVAGRRRPCRPFRGGGGSKPVHRRGRASIPLSC